VNIIAICFGLIFGWVISFFIAYQNPFSVIKENAIKWKWVVCHKYFKLWWHRLWIRKDEFHESLDINVKAVLTMNKKQKKEYFMDLAKRRQIAHKTDLARNP